VDDRSAGAPEPREDRASIPNGAPLGRSTAPVDRRWADGPRAPDHRDPGLEAIDRGAHPVIARTRDDAGGTTVRVHPAPAMAEAGVRPATDLRGATSDLDRASRADNVRSTAHDHPVGRTTTMSMGRERHSRRPRR